VDRLVEPPVDRCGLGGGGLANAVHANLFGPFTFRRRSLGPRIDGLVDLRGRSAARRVTLRSDPTTHVKTSFPSPPCEGLLDRLGVGVDGRGRGRRRSTFPGVDPIWLNARHGGLDLWCGCSFSSARWRPRPTAVDPQGNSSRRAIRDRSQSVGLDARLCERFIGRRQSASRHDPGSSSV